MIFRTLRLKILSIPTAKIIKHLSQRGNKIFPSPNRPPKLLDHACNVLHHYSIHTERASVNWIVRFVRFHRMRSREDLVPTASKIEAFLTDLAVRGNVAPATPNQAMYTLAFLSKRVCKHPWEGRIDAVRAVKKINFPVVMTR